MKKAHVIVYRSIITEEWLVEGASNAAEAREMFLDGQTRFISRSEMDDGNVRSIRLATELDMTNADANDGGIGRLES